MSCLWENDEEAEVEVEDGRMMKDRRRRSSGCLEDFDITSSVEHHGDFGLIFVLSALYNTVWCKRQSKHRPTMISI